MLRPGPEHGTGTVPIVPPSVEYVPRNEWTRVVPAKIGELAANVRVSVVVPARDCQAELDRTLAALSEQSYPGYLLDVILVDDASHPPLRLPELRPESTELLRLGDAGVHGSGRARAAGAVLAEGEVLLFLDADMIADRHHVEAHLRWHHVLADAVVLGAKEFVDVDGIDPLQVRDAVRKGSLEELLSGREHVNHTWLDRYINKTGGLTRAGGDLFTAVVGASVSVPRRLYHECGGFGAFDRRGIVDTEFGYRAVTAGAVVVPEPQARSVHQGVRAFAARGEEIKRLRAGLAANQLPHRIFRPPVRGRVWAVPAIRVLVDADGSSYERLVVTVDSLLAQDLYDLAVTLHGDIEPETEQLLADYFGHDPRVLLAGGALVDTGFPSPYTAFMPAGVVLGRGAIGAVVDRLERDRLGLIRAPIPAGELRLWRTAALHRARRAAASDRDPAMAAEQLFDDAVLPTGSVEATPAQPRVNRTGMVYDATLTPRVEQAGAIYLRGVSRARAAARARLRKVRRYIRAGKRYALRLGHRTPGARQT